MPKKIPFYTQAAILDNFIHSPTPGKDPNALKLILDLLRTRQDLQEYFFQRMPNVSWAKVLSDNGFLSTPPELIKDQDNKVLPRWHAQEFLISVADQVPEVVLNHLGKIEGDGWYLSRSIEAICKISPKEAVHAVPKIISWLDCPQLAWKITRNVTELIKHLSLDETFEAAFELFNALIKPVRPIEKSKKLAYYNSDAISLIHHDFEQEKLLKKIPIKLLDFDHNKIISILENNLCECINIESDIKNIEDYSSSSYWRSAIEDSDQDRSSSYKGKLLVSLRNTLCQAINDDKDLTDLIGNYLESTYIILRRIALYLLSLYPAKLNKFLEAELVNSNNFEDTEIHHEFFTLLEKGFNHVTQNNKKAILDRILAGPPIDKVKEQAEWAKENRDIDPGEYIENYNKRWIRDRLWMIKEYLTGNESETLSNIVKSVGEPDHPDFTRWHSGVYSVLETSPISKEELSKMSVQQFLDFIKNWKPDPAYQFGPEQISYNGLSKLLADIIFNDLQKYKNYLLDVALQRSEYATAIFEYFLNDSKKSPIPWSTLINFFEGLLDNDTVRSFSIDSQADHWCYVRKKILNMIEVGLEDDVSERLVPREHLGRIKDILLLLVYDLDPDETSDRPHEGSLGHNDPATVAINHVRPKALSILIKYALQNAKSQLQNENEGPGPQRIEEEVKTVLTEKLNKESDPSLAVHSVFGHYLWVLFWMDKDWVISQINKIFPESESEAPYFTSAWDSFVIFNRFNLALIELLAPKYKLAISYLARGYVSETHLNPVENLAVHLFLEYLLSDKVIKSNSEKDILICQFFETVSPDHRGQASWNVKRILTDNPKNIQKFWPKIKSFWEWRVRKASIANNSTDFDKEMESLAQIPIVAPEEETVVSLRPLIEGVLPHIARDDHGRGWHELEKYLAREVERDSLNVIEIYYLMNTQKNRPRWHLQDEERKQIIEKAIKNPKSRRKTLSLIDHLGHIGIYDYKDMYEKYS